MASARDAVSDSVRMAIHFFVNFDLFKWLYLAYFMAPDVNLHSNSQQSLLVRSLSVSIVTGWIQAPIFACTLFAM